MEKNDVNPLTYSSGSAVIDAIRREVKASPTAEDNYRRRALLLYMWLSALQQQGGDTRPYTSVDTASIRWIGESYMQPTRSVHRCCRD